MTNQQIDMFSFGVAVSHYMNDDGNFEFSAESLTSLLESYSYEEEEPTKEKKVKTTKPTKTKKSGFLDMESDDLEFPETWRYCGKSIYLTGYAKDPDTGKTIKKIKTFEEAMKKADELEYHCSGITLTSTGFSLRASNMPRENPDSHYKSGMASWVKTLPSTDPDVDSDTDYEGDEQQRTAVAVEKKRYKAEVEQKSTDAEDESTSDDDESDSDSTEVIEVEVDGKRLYYDEEQTKLYDPVSHKEVGGLNEEGKYYLF